jgi:hypothetical protein
MSFRKKFIIIFLEEKIGSKMNYLKRQWCDWASIMEIWGTALGWYGKMRQDEEKK